jgi:hypothetical protein
MFEHQSLPGFLTLTFFAGVANLFKLCIPDFHNFLNWFFIIGLVSIIFLNIKNHDTL